MLCRILDRNYFIERSNVGSGGRPGNHGPLMPGSGCGGRNDFRNGGGSPRTHNGRVLRSRACADRVGSPDREGVYKTVFKSGHDARSRPLRFTVRETIHLRHDILRDTRSAHKSGCRPRNRNPPVTPDHLYGERHRGKPTFRTRCHGEGWCRCGSRTSPVFGPNDKRIGYTVAKPRDDAGMVPTCGASLTGVLNRFGRVACNGRPPI